jgi:hypothetical protein
LERVETLPVGLLTEQQKSDRVPPDADRNGEERP